MSGASCADSAGAASAPAGGRWSATKKPSGIGSAWVGRGLKKSAPRTAYLRLYRRERAERAAPSGAHLGPARTDSGVAVSFQLEAALGGGRHHLVELLFPALPKNHSRGRSSELLGSSAAPPARQAVGGLGSFANPSRSAGKRVGGPPARPHRARVPSRLRAGTQSGGVHLGLLETSRVAQLLPARLRPTQLSCPSRIAPDAPATHPGDGVLGASRPVSTVTILWCSRQRLSFSLVKVQPRQSTSRPGSIPDCREGNESMASSGVTRPQAPGGGAERSGGQAKWRAAT